MGFNTFPCNPYPISTEKLDALRSGFTNLDNEVNGDANVYPYADVITIEDAVPANLADCSVKIEPVQSGSGDPSPTNVRPITGHTEVSVEVTDGDETTKTYTIALGSTIYGGTVDIDSGVMTVDRASVTFDGSDDESWEMLAGVVGFYGTTKSDAKYSVGYKVLCNELEPINNTIAWADILTHDNAVNISKKSGSDVPIIACVKKDIAASDWRTYLASNPLQVCYQLATPTTIQLTPQQIQLLKGTNTLTASTGQISVTVNGVSGSIGAVQEQVNVTDAVLAELAEQLPDAPTTDGAYVLTVTVADGTPTYSWESTT